MTHDRDAWATWTEIHQQPKIWQRWGAALQVNELREWIAKQAFDEVWFCGAGTSAYIGDIISAALPKTRSVPTTDIVADPARVLAGAKPLVVNFGRSGDSAESLGTLDALDALAPYAPRLNITCNPDGTLARRPSPAPQRVVLLPEETHDAGFAMTSSFSTMLLTALALFDAPCDVPARFATLADQLEKLLKTVPEAPVPDRVVYLGAGPLTFAAREAALKVLELSAGKIPAMWDSSLGFRHGPKSFVTDDTLVTLFTSGQAPTSAYDADLVAELRQQFPKARIETVGPGGDMDIATDLPPVWYAALCVAVAQLRSVAWSHHLGLNVDNPFEGQSTLTRVVSGVTLYPVAP